MSFDICLGFDEKFAPHAAATMVSVLCNHDFSNRIAFHLMYANLSETTKNRISSLQDKWDFDLHFVDMLTIIDPSLPTIRDSYAPYFRLYLGKILPNSSKALYLDSDVIVHSELNSLFDWNIENKYAAVVDIGKVSKSHPFRHLMPDIWFNSGVMLLNLDLMRENDILSRATDLAKQCGAMIEQGRLIKAWFGDQMLLNNVFGRNVVFLPYSWNTFALPELINIQSGIFLGEIMERYPKKEIDETFRNPKILHFIAPKPWIFDVPAQRHPWEDFYWKHLKQTPFYDDVCRRYHEQERAFFDFAKRNQGRSEKLMQACDRCLKNRDVESIFSSLSTDKKLALFGAGPCGTEALQYIRLFERQTGKKFRPIDFFIDNDPQKSGTELEGIPVRNMEALTSNVEIVLTSTHVDEILHRFYEKGVVDLVRGSFCLDCVYFGRK